MSARLFRCRVEPWLDVLLTTSDNLLVSIQEKIKWADSMAEIDKKHKKEMDGRVEDVKMSLSGFRLLNNKPSIKVKVTNCEQEADNDFRLHEEIFSRHGGLMDQDRIRPKR
ncbi:hypothetical protein CASFOL_041193 [Castilleja foliolosa]|uniref:Uncharacterized protein n=1 Tax=Castilleja foliolosa TaxID=1961234 RepID=A0ABD3BE19_9LAMI